MFFIEGLQEAWNEPNAQNVEGQGPQDVGIQEYNNKTKIPRLITPNAQVQTWFDCSNK